MENSATCCWWKYAKFNVPHELGDLANEIFRQNVEGVAWLLLLLTAK